MASSIFTIAWVKGAGERALKSGIQGGIAGLGLSVTAAVTPGNLPGVLDLPWGAAASGFVVLAILSIATSVAQPDFTAGEPVIATPPAELDELDDAEVEDIEDDREDLDDDEIPVDDEQPVEAGLGNESPPEHAAQ